MGFSGDSIPPSTRRYYESVLGVPRRADPATVKAAFRDLAAKYHPDRNDAPDAARQFRQIAEAYAALHPAAERRPDPQRASYPMAGCRRGTNRAGARWLSPEDLWAGLDVEAVFGGRPACLSGVERTLVRQAEDSPAETQAAPGPSACSACGDTGEVPEYEHRGKLLFRRTVPCTSCGKECER